MKRDNIKRKHLARDLVIIILSIAAAHLLVEINAFQALINSTGEVKVLGSFIAGLFFTSIFTTPLAIVVLGELTLTSSLFSVALLGACGALLGDIVIYYFVKDSVAQDIQYVISKASFHKRLFHIFKLRIFRWITPFIGALVIASPLPDELGIAMMGLSKMKLSVMAPVSFIMNFIGILIIGLVANSMI